MKSLMFALLSTLCMHSVYGMIYDNRFWPLYQQQFFSYQKDPEASWYWSLRPMFMGADNAFFTDDEEGNLFEISGMYDERVLDTALQKAGVIPQSLIPTQFAGLESIPWTREGKMSLRGCALETEWYPHHNVSIGGSLFVGHMELHQQEFIKNEVAANLSNADLFVLRQANLDLHTAMGLSAPAWHALAIGDIELYVKGRITRSYWHKLHYLDIAVRFGMYMPAGERASLYNPVSVPLGGQSALGLYVQCDTNIILNDLISVGFGLQVSKRLSHSFTQRFPLLTEPTPYGALVATGSLSQGVTFAFHPYVQFGGIRDGLGLMGGYYMVHHAADTWSVAAQIQDQYKPQLELLTERSAWGSDHFNIGAYYDFGYECEKVWYKPIVSLTVDIPWNGPVTKRVPQVHGISIRIESLL